MKKIFLTLAIALASYSVYAQTNTFPSSGNVGIGTNSPQGKLDVNGAILIPGSANNIMTRPAVSSSRITGEITGYSSPALVLDDGFLRLSAGGGTNPVKSYIDLSGFSLIPDMYQNITMGTSGSERIRITSSGNVGIGTATPDVKLAVNGTIHAKEVKVDLTGWPDYVFKPAYKLPTLREVKTYIDKNQHLPDMQSEQEAAKNGINLGEVNKLLLKKVEELTLYLIEQDKRINKLETQLKIKNKVPYR